MAANHETERLTGSNALIAKWGNELFDDGISNFPQCFIRYGRRFVSAAHFSVICNILSYQYGSDTPYPSQETVAENMGISTRRLKKLLSELEEEGNVEIYWRYVNGKRSSSEYNFKPLLDKCLAYSHQLKAEKNKNTKVVKRKKTGKKLLSEQCVPLLSEQCVPLLSEQCVPLLSEQCVPSNKVIEEVSFEESNLINLSIKKQIKNIDLPFPIIDVLKNTIDRLITFEIDVNNIEKHYKAVRDTYTEDEYAYVLESLLQEMKSKPKRFGAVMKNWLNRNRANMQKEKKPQSIRNEIVPKWLHEQKNEPTPASFPYDPKEMRKKIEESRKRILGKR